MRWRSTADKDLHVGQFARHDEAVVADEGAAGGEDAPLAVCGQWQLGRARVAAVERPFGFAVADDEDAGGGAHVWLVGTEEGMSGEFASEAEVRSRELGGG